MTNTAVITFGRFQPITIGHEKLVNKVKSFAQSIGADAFVYLSHSHDKNKNPLPYLTKLYLAKTAFGDVVVNSPCKSLIDVVKTLQHYDNINIFVGSDRVDGFNDLLQKYNGIDYSFKEINVLSAGYREDSAKGISGVSGTKIRSYAINNDMKSFVSVLPAALKPQASYIMKQVRKGLDYEN